MKASRPDPNTMKVGIFNDKKMAKKSPLDETLKVSTLLLFALFIGSTFCSILCLDENKINEGCFLGFYGFSFLLLTLWSDRSFFYPVVVGSVFYTALVITSVYFFPKVIMEGIGILSPYIYLMLGFLAFIYLISYEYKKRKTTVVNSTHKKEEWIEVEQH